MRLGGAGGRLIHLGERKRGAQFEAARALLLRDGDGGQERFLCRRGVGRITLEQHLAARPMQFGVERAMADPFRRGQRFVEVREGATEIACAGVGVSERNSDESVKEQDVLVA